MAATRRAFLATLVAALLALRTGAADAAPRRSGGLLWQVARPGTPDSWLFGTLHQADARLLPLPPPVLAAFAACRRLVIELHPDEAVSARFSEGARGGSGLEALLGGAAFTVLCKHLAAQGLPPTEVDALKPWAALLLLSTLPRPAELNSIDNELFIQARFANMHVVELDSVEEQLAVFDDIPVVSQLALLEAAIDFHELLPALAEDSVRAWLAGDLTRLRRLSRVLEGRRPALAPHQRVLEKKVIDDRSVVMAYRAQSYLRRGASFIAVGAAHLHGRQGLPALLRRDYGWRLRPVW